MRANKIFDSKTSFYTLLVTLILLFNFSNIRQFADYSFIDFKFNYIKKENINADEIVTIGFDEESFSKINEPVALWHEYIKKAIDYAIKNHAKLIVLDMIIPKKSYNFLIEDIDTKLFSALLEAKKNSNLIIPSTYNEDGEKVHELPIIISLIGDETFAHPLLKVSHDGKIRELPKNIKNRNSISELAAKFLNAETKSGLINYSIGNGFDYIPFIDIIDGKVNRSGEDDLKEKIFFIGMILPFEDRRKTPISILKNDYRKGTSPGILVHLQSLVTYLNNAAIVEIPSAICLLFGLILATFYFFTRNDKLGSPICALLFIFLMIPLSIFLQSAMFISLPISTLCFSIFLAIISKILLNSLINYELKIKLTNEFGKYVSPSVMDKILDGEISPESSLSRKKVAVLFSDIRSFTNRSEHENPENIAILLNKYFEEMINIVHKNNGTVDKFIGDGLMVFFGAPNELDNPAQNAIDSAMEMIDSVKKINIALERESIEAIRIGIGIHCGDAVIGHIGSKDRYEYTAIGDVVNLAARLESKTKELGYEIVCSSSIKNDLKDFKKLEYIGDTPIKGRTNEKVFGLYKI